MSNTLLSPTAIVNESLRILHQKPNFITNINRQYDDRFAQTGAKIGNTLTLRLPNEYTVTTGATMAVQDTAESSVVITVATQKHVAMNFVSADLTMTIDRFSERYIVPAINRLSASIESDAFSTLYKDVYNLVDNDTNVPSFLNVMQAKQKLDEGLVPEDGRNLILSPNHNTKIVDALKGLFNPQMQLGTQLKSGSMGRTADFDFFSNTHFTDHTTGTAAKTTGYTVSGASQSGAAITVTGGTTTFLKGDIVTFAGCNRVHPESKVSYGTLQQFVITTNSGASATSLAISPTIVLSGAKQNVSAAPTDTGAVVKVGAGASELLNSSLAFHPDFATIVFADLEDMSKYGAWGARKQIDGISMRIWRQGDIYNDAAPCRIDVFYGVKTLRPQLACRIHADG